MPHIAFYITGHGFGHATRTAAIALAVAERLPGVRLSLVTAVPEWLFRLSLPVPFTLRPAALDVGVVQPDAIRLDGRATLEAYAALLARLPALVDREAAQLRQDRVDLIVADIPPAAFAIARRLDVPAVGISNFSWDWIYAEYAADAPEYLGVVSAIRADYAGADLFLRLPFHGPCDASPVVRDIPMVARRSRRTREDIRRQLGVNGARPVVLLSFGGFEVQGIDFERVERLGEFLFLATQAPPRPVRNVQVVPLGSIPYEDLVAQADVVITKPGYGIVSECLANRTRVCYTPRGQFAEYERLLDGLQRFGVAEALPTADFLAGEWRASLHAVLERPGAWPDLPADGAAVAAEALLALV
jgi:L-arabinokinase